MRLRDDAMAVASRRRGRRTDLETVVGPSPFRVASITSLVRLGPARPRDATRLAASLRLRS
jgi:hypothetical protein